MPPVFDTSKCSLPSIPAIGDFSFIADCAIPEAPPPIFECPDLSFDLPIAGPAGMPGKDGMPGQLGPCIDLNINGSVTALETYAEPSVTVTAEDMYPGGTPDQCGQVVNFRFGLPRAVLWRSGCGAPGGGLGNIGDYYLDICEPGNGNVYTKTLSGWGSPVGNIKGDPGNDTIMPCCPVTTYSSIVTGVYCQGNQLLIQYQS
jgi:hypothetical protein